MKFISLIRAFSGIIVACLLVVGHRVQAQTTRTIPTGSYIVNMGVSPQTVGNGLKPYGLVYDLVKNFNVPIFWVINPSKGKDGIDFSHNGIDYKGGPFIIPVEYRSTAVNDRITFWQSQGVVGATTVSSISVPVAETITSAPNWTLDQKNGSIAAGYFTNAGIPSSSYNFKDPALLGSCDDIFVMPHADPTWATHSNLLTWNQTSRGAIWAACHAVSALEDMFNPANPSQQTNFLSAKTGTATGNGPYSENALILWGNHSNGSPPYNYSNPTDPVMQFMGIMDAATQNGSEQIYLPKQNWLSSTRLSVIDPTQADVPGKSPGPAAVVAYGSAFGDANRGKVMYEGGHSHNKGSAGDVAAQRAFFNFSFWANKDKALQVSAPTLPSNLVGGQAYNVSSSVSASVPSGPYTYQWTSTCGGTFANPTAASTTFTPSTVAGNTSCVVQLKVTDACGRSNTTSSVVVVTPGPRPPVAVNDVGTIAASCATSGTSLTLNVLANDSDPDGDPLTLTGVTGNNGTWTFNASTGLVTYQPAANFTGTATATYTVCAPSPQCSTGTITVSVGSADANGCFPGSAFMLNLQISPTAQTSTSVDNPTNAFNVDYDESNNATYAVINNNADVLTLDFGQVYTKPTADSVRIYFATGTDGSSVTIQASYSTDGTNFTVAGSYSTSNKIDGAEASFVVPAGGIRYLRIVRTAGSPNLFIDAGVLEDFTCQSVVPVATNDEVSASEDIPVIINVLDNNASPAGLALSVRNIVTNPTNGKVSINPDNTITYVNNTDYSGTDSFTYRVCDTQGFCTNATVIITIADDNCATGQYRPFNTTTTSTTLTAIDDSQVRKDRATDNYGNNTSAEIGKKEANARRGIYLFDLSSIPSGAIIQSASFSIIRTGGDAVTLSLSAHRLTESWLESQVTWNSRSTGTNWSTAGGTYISTAAATISAAATNGAKTFGVTNLVQNWVNGTYQNHGILVKQSTEVLDKRHQYATSENGTAANRPQLAITYVTLAPCIAIPNRAPLANPDYTTTPSNAPVSIAVLANDSDPDAGNTISLSAIVGTVTGGSATISGNNIVFTPSNTFTGTAIVRYRITDGTLTDESFAYITVTNVPPVAVNDVVSYNSNTTNNFINVLANDLNPDGPNPLTTSIVKLPANGTATLSGTNIVYTPNQNYFGRDTIQYRACEPVDPTNCAAPSCSTAFVYITVNNRPPVAVADASTTIGCVPKQINVLSNDSDPENGPLTITSATVATANAGTVTISADKTYIVFAPQQGFIGNATVNYTICDNGNPALCASSTVTVSVNTGTATNSPPVAVNDIGEDITRAQIAYIGVLSNDTDPEGTSLTISLPSPNISPANSGTVALFGTSQVMFTPNAGFLGTATFQYQVCDQSPPVGIGCPALPSQCSTASVSVKVINQAPQPINDNASTGTNISKNIFPLANDNEPDGDVLILQTGGTTSKGGTMVLNNNGTPSIFTDDYYVYTPPTNFVGQDQFTYTVCDNVASPNNLCSTATIFITIAPPIDLQLTKTFAPNSPVSQGSTVTFTLSLFNNSVTPATGVTVLDLLSSSYQFQSSTGTGSYDVSSGIWAIGTVGANATVTRTITVTVNNFNSLTNTAEVYTANEPDFDSSPNNNNPTEDDQSSVTPQSGADLAITKTDNKAFYTPGTTVTYSVVVSNQGPSTATGATVVDNAPAGTTITSWSAVFAGGASGTASGSGNLNQTVTIPTGGTITYTINVQVPAGFTGNLVNTATVNAPAGASDPNTANNIATDTNTPDIKADLSITKTDGSTTYTPGNAVTYTVVVSNAGPSTAAGATVVDNAPAGTTITSWSAIFAGGASGTASGSGNLNQTVTIPPGATVTYTINLSVPPGQTGNLVNIATVNAPAGTTDPNTANNNATDTNTPDIKADLSITKTDGSTTYTPGVGVTYTLVVSNAGPSTAAGATVVDNAPSGTTITSWSAVFAGGASGTASGSGNLNQTVTIPPSGTVTYTINLSVPPGQTGNLVNTATVNAPAGTTDPNPANNNATDTNTPDIKADLNITKTDGSTTYTPGTTVTYTVVVGNTGPSTATGATFVDNAPAGTTISSWTATFAGGATSPFNGGNGNINTTVTVPPNGTITYTINVQVPPGITGNLVNTATVTAPAGTTDANTTNNTATDTNTPDIKADLSITKTDGSTTYTPGESVSYTVVVSNAGPSNAVGATVVDNAPAGTTISSWTATFAGGASGTASGSGNLNQTVNVPSGGSIIYTIDLSVPSGRTGDLINIATVSAPAGTTDPNATNNTATDTDTQSSVSDLRVTKTDGRTTYVAGTTTTYTIVASNLGPSNVTGASLIDNIPAGVTWSYTSTGTAGTSGNTPNGTGNINDLLTIPNGGSITYTVVVTIPSGFTGNLTNTATISAPAGTSDPNTANNNATDINSNDPQADLRVTKTDNSTTYTPGTTTTYTIVASNLGPSNVIGANLIDNIPTGVTWSFTSTGTAGTSGNTPNGTGNINDLLTIPNGGSITYTVVVTIPSGFTGNLTNTATISTPAGIAETNPDDNTATDINTPNRIADLSITKTDGSPTYTPGVGVTYTVVVSNAGPSNAVGATVVDTAPAGTTISSWTATFAGGASGTASGSGNLNQTVNVPSGGSITYTINLSVPPGQTGNLVNTATVTAPTGTTDSNPANNTATDTNSPDLRSNLGITKTDGQTTAIPGNQITYTITVTNAGPSTAMAVPVNDIIPNTITNVSWTSAITGSGMVPTGASGSGNNLSATVDLAPGAGNFAVFTVTGIISPSASGTLTNTASLTLPNGVTDPDLSNNSSTDNTTLVPTADLAITKTDNATTYTPGQNLTYIIVVENNGPSDVTGATVTDILPASLSDITWTSVVSGDATLTSGGTGSGNSLSALVNLPAGSANKVTFTVNAKASPAASGDLINTASITVPSGVTDPTPGNNSASDTDTQNSIVDLAISKTDFTTTYTPGTTVKYTIIVSNTGPSNATGATVTDNAPTGTSITGWTASFTGGASGTASGSGNISQIVNVPVGGQITYLVDVAVPSSYKGNLVNTATVSAPEGTTDSDLSNNSATVSDTEDGISDIAILKTVNNSTPNVGSEVIFTLTVTNNGPSDASGVVVSDLLPSGYTYVSDNGAGAYLSGTGQWTVGTLPNAATASLQITATVKASGNYTNTATVSSDESDSFLDNNTSTVTPTPVPTADLSITKTDGKTTYTPGTTVTYTVVVSNAGPSNLSGATVVDNAPLSTSITSWTASFTGGATGTASGSGNISQTVNIPKDGTITYTIQLAIPSDFSGNLVNTASVSVPAGTTDPDTDNNTATDTNTQSSFTDLAIVKTVSNPTPNVGSQVTFTLSAINNGPSDASGVIVSDLLPSGYTYISDNGAGAYVSNTGQWTIGTLPNAATASLQITATVKASGNYTNTATITGNQPDTTQANNTSSATTTPVPVADLSITKTDGKSTYTPGTTVTYTVVVSNTGPSDVSGATVVDNAPSGTSITNWTASFTGGATGTASGSGNISQSVDIPLGGNATYTINLIVPAGFTGTLQNTASVMAPAGTIDPATGNNSATDIDTQNSLSDLGIVKAISNQTPKVGSTVVFTLTVTNHGPSNATGVKVTDLLPAGFTYLSDNGAGAYVSNNGEWTIGNLAALATVSLEISARVNVSGSYTNTAVVTANQNDPTLGNNSSSITATPIPQSDLSISKTVSNDNPNVGSNVTFTLIATNNGLSAATGVSINDQLPSGYTYVSDNGVGAYNSSTGIWTIGNLANSATATLQIVAKIKASGNYVNVATISGNEEDPNPGNNTASSTPLPIDQTDLSIVKTVDNTTPDIDSNVIFTLTVSNQGPSAATGVVVYDPLPSGYTYVSDNAGGDYNHQSGLWSIGGLANSATATLSIIAKVNASGQYSNTASVTGNEQDPTPGNNSSTRTTNPVPVVDLAISKTDGTSTYTPGMPVIYTIVVTNAGPSAANGATVSDILPAEMTNVSWTSAVNGAASVSAGATGTGNSLSALVNIEAGAGNSVTFTVTGTVISSATGSLVNTAQVTTPAGTKDPNVSNNSSTDTNTPELVSDLSISKTDGSATYTPGTTVSYTLNVNNAGPSDAISAKVFDSAPNGTTITGWTATFSGGATGATIGSGTLDETVTIPTGGSISYTVSVSVPSGYTGPLNNTATITTPAGTSDPNLNNNSSTDLNTADPVADLSITKTDNTLTYTPGTTTTYIITASNAGPSDASNVSIIDNIPTGTTWSYTATGSTGTSGFSTSGTGNINDIVTIPVGGSITYTVLTTIPENFTGNLVNTAQVTVPSTIRDLNPANDQATDTDTQKSVADLAITNTDGTATYTPGTTTTYTVVATNNGPSAVIGAMVTNNAPAGTTITGWNAVFAGGATGSASGNGNIDELVSLPVGSTITYTITVAIPSGVSGNLVSTATISAPPQVTDPTPGNNSATDTDAISRTADLSASKSDGVVTYTPGSTTTYTLLLSNAGPSDVTGASIIDNIPTGTSWSYTSSGTTGTSGNTTSGTNHIGDLVSIPVGGSITYTVTLTVPSSFTGNLVNKVTITAPAGTTDPQSNNNSATDTNTQNSRADLSITNTDGINTYTPGTSTSYKVVVKNAGPSNAIGAVVSNPAPAGTTITGWSAVLGGGAAGTTTGNGDINQIVSIPAGDSITYTVIVSIPANYTGNLVNQASVAPPAGLTDPTPGNNSATDTDTPDRIADLSLTKTNGSTSYTPGTMTTYILVATNAGPSDVVGATVTDVIPAGITWNYTSTGTAGTTGNAASGNGNINDQVTIPAGGKITYTVTATIPADYTGNLTNVATITAPANTTDPNPGNNSATDTDTQNSSTDLAVAKSITVPRPEAGAQVTFSLLVTNNGPSAATGVNVQDLLPTGYTYISHSGTGTYTSGTGRWDIGNLALNSTATLQIVATINTAGEYTNMAEVFGDQNDPVTSNNKSSAGVKQLLLLPKVYLQGALFGITYTDAPANSIVDSLMRDDLRSVPSFPTTSPYSDWTPTVAANTILPAVLTTTGPDAIVDWVFVELRSATNPATIVSARSALLQRDGDIVNLDGTSPLDYRAVAGATYYVTVRHRNHLAVMSASPLALTPAGLVIDFRQPSTPVYLKGTSSIHKARVDVLQGRAMWAGNTLRDGKVVYQGSDNDVNVVSQQVINASGNGNRLPFYILSGYHQGDVSLNGKVIFQGFNNDVEFIYQNVIKNHPGNTQKDNFFVIQEQLP